MSINISDINNKIRIASFICTVFVLYRHSINYLAFFHSYRGYGLTGFVEDSISEFTEIAVPVFFLISGFFFFKYDYYQKGSYTSMIKKKIKSLVIPFCLWNLIVAAFLLFHDTDKLGNNFQEFIYNLITSNWNGPLWYVRDLIVIMFLCPLYYWIYKLDNKCLYSFVLILLYLRWWPIDTTILSTECQLFFMIGGVLRKNSYLINYKLPSYILYPLFIFWCLNCFDIIAIHSIHMHRITTVIGIIVFWRLLDFIKKDIYNILYNLSAYSFFIYVMHFYLEKILKNIIASYFYGNNFIALLTYILVPILCIVITVYIAKLWMKTSEVSYRFATGGR